MNYWLFKTEPDEFSIDDLQALGQTSECWNGIRNYQARNILRDQVKPGDLVFIYHSSCKLVGIAGVAEVVSEAYADPSQFDKNSGYHDAKSSKESPRWYCVDVCFRKKFNKIIELSQIKSNKALTEMALVKQGRLSIQPVTAQQWKLLNGVS